MIQTSNRVRPTRAVARDKPGLGGELEIVTRLLDAVAEAGLSMDRNASVNFYVAVKSKPLTLLAGPSQSGKIALVRCLAKELIGRDSASARLCPHMHGGQTRVDTLPCSPKSKHA